jgi:hypothetical protein
MNESLIEHTTVEISRFGHETHEILRRFPTFHECEETMNRFPRKGFQVQNIIRERLESLKRRIARRLDKLKDPKTPDIKSLGDPVVRAFNPEERKKLRKLQAQKTSLKLLHSVAQRGYVIMSFEMAQPFQGSFCAVTPIPG